MTSKELKAKFPDMYLAESQEALANIDRRRGDRDTTIVISNARKEQAPAQGIVDPLGELANKQAAARQNILTSALRGLRRRRTT